eukprot:9750208-Alexandrium_andersonii.AAC.1
MLPRDMMRHGSCYGIARCAAPRGAKRYDATWVVTRGAATPKLPRDASWSRRVTLECVLRRVHRIIVP